MNRVLLILVVFCVLILPIQADEIAKEPFSLAFQLGVYPNIVRYGEITFIAVEVKNVSKNFVNVRSALWETGYSDCEIELYSASKESRLVKWLNKDEFDVNENLPDARKDTAVNITTKEMLPSECHIIMFRPVWIPPMNHEGNDFRSQLGNHLTRESLTLWIKSKFYLEHYLIFTNDVIRQQKRESTFKFPDLKITIDPTSQNTYKQLRKWYQEIPGPYRWTDNAFFQLKDDDRDSQFYVPEYLSGEARNKARRAINLRLKRYLYYNQPEPRNEFIETRIKRANELASDLLKEPDTVISSHMKEFIVLRGFLVELRYADENELSHDKVFNKIIAWLKTAKFKTTWVLVLKESGLPSIENAEHFPQQVVNDYINKLSKIFPKEINVTIDDLNKEYKNILLNSPEPKNKTDQNLSSSSTTTIISTAPPTSVSPPPSSEQQQIDSTEPSTTQPENNSSWGIVFIVIVVILFAAVIAWIIFVRKILYK